jgi:protein-tyrosine phosphatase
VPDDTFDVVFVCTGNQFRSPLAAAVLARETEGLPVRVSSCGTGALDGAAAFAEAAELGTRLSVDLSGHRSRRLGPLGDADLVVGFERHHVERAVVDAGAPRERAFTLPQLVELLEAHPGNGSPGERLARVRPGNMLDAPEILDPFGEPSAAQEAIADEVEDLSRRLAVALFASVA